MPPRRQGGVCSVTHTSHTIHRWSRNNLQDSAEFTRTCQWRAELGTSWGTEQSSVCTTWGCRAKAEAQDFGGNLWLTVPVPFSHKRLWNPNWSFLPLEFSNMLKAMGFFWSQCGRQAGRREAMRNRVRVPRRVDNLRWQSSHFTFFETAFLYCFPL